MQSLGSKTPAAWLAFLAASFCLSASPLPLFAQSDLSDLSFEELMAIPVFAASKTVQDISEAPAFVTVVTGAEISLFGDQTIEDVLNRVAGFYATNDRAYSYLGSRGFGRPGDYNTRYLMLVNGVRVNESLYGSFGSGRDMILHPEIIDRIEIVRGSSSSLYGTSAFFGVINVITRTPEDIGGVELGAEYGSHGFRRGSLTVGHGFASGVEVTAHGSLFGSDGQAHYFEEFDDPATNNGVTDPAADAESDADLFLEILYGDLRVQSAFSSRKKHIPTGAWDTIYNDPRSLVEDKVFSLDARLQKEYFSGWLGTGRVGLNRATFTGDYPFDYADPGDQPEPEVNRDTSTSTTWSAELTVSTENYRNQVLTFGGEVRWSNQLDQANFDVSAPDEPYFEDQRNSVVWGVFAQDEFQLSRQLVVNAGLRYDRYESFGGALNPRLALVATPARGSTVKLMYGEAFRAPNAYEMHYNDGDEYQKANPDLAPEEIRSFELVYEQKLNRHWQATGAAYHYNARSLIEIQEDPSDGLLVFRNLGDVETDGLDLILDGRTNSGLATRLSYSYARGRERTSDAPLTNSPENMVKLTLTVPLLDRHLHAGLSVRYMSSRLAYDEEIIDSHTITDLTLHVTVPGTGLALNAGLYNLFDEQYSWPVGDEHVQNTIAGDGRTGRIGAKYAF